MAPGFVGGALAVESHSPLEIIRKLQSLDGMTDDELRALLDETEALIKQLPPGR